MYIESKKYLFILFICCCFSINTFAQDHFFNVLKKEDNTAFDGIVNSILRDRDGFLWIGYSGKLVRYDGSSYLNFESSNNDSTTISQTDIESIFEDQQGLLWFCTKEGLNLYNKETQSFKRIYPFKNKGSVKNRIKAICQLNDSIYFVASYGGGLCKYNSKVDRFTNVYLHTNSPNSLPSNVINTVFIDSKKQLWVGTESGGLSCMNYATGTFKNYLPDAKNTNALSDNTVSSVVEDKRGILWVGTWRGGLNRFDPKSEQFQSFANRFPSQTIRTIVKGQSDEIWLATYKGIVRFNTVTNQSTIFLHDPFDPQSLHYNVNWSLCFDQENILWVGSYGKGVCYSPQTSSTFSIPEKWNIKYRETLVNTIQRDDSKLWFGSENAGIFIWDYAQKTISEFNHNETFNGKIISCIKKDSQGDFWIGSNNGLYFLHNNALSFIPKTKGNNITCIVDDGNGGFIAGGFNTGLIHIKSSQSDKDIEITKADSKNALPSNIIWNLFTDSKKRVWVSTSQGLGLWNSTKNCFTLLYNDQNTFAINQDIDNKIWCGPSSGQLLYFDEQKQKFIVFYVFKEEKYHIASIHFSEKWIWISTLNGLIRLDKKSKTERRFTVADGLPSNYFTNAYQTLPNGTIVLGTANGPIILNPKNAELNAFKPHLLITNIEILGKKKLFANNRITLKYSENKITISFAALSLLSNGIITYNYKLQGFDKEAVTTTDRKAIYTNLQPGIYTFKVNYNTSDDIHQNEPTTLTIEVLAPWWMTWWFRIIMAILILSCIVLIFYLRLWNIKNRNKILKKEVKNRTIALNERAVELEKLNETKNKLFSIIGHDLKNPMSVISNNADLLIDSYDKYDTQKVKSFIAAMGNSSRNAFLLLNNLLDWARSQQNSVYIKTESIDVSVLLNESIQLISEQLKTKDISLTIANNSKCNVLADKNVLQTCLRNVISNALKYSHPHSEISIIIDSVSDSTIQIKIKDQGIGMSNDRLERIFSINKSSQAGTAHEKGTGLGLIIVKDFVAMMHGNITIESEENTGTTVLINLPATDEIPIQQLPIDYSSDEGSLEEKSKYLSDESIRYLKAKQILIIDDDPDLRMSLKAVIEQFANVHEASDARIGLDMITQLQPDLIICDVEMPGMTGFELCEKVKTNVAISHIPFILLTALDSNLDTVTGLLAGADDYLTKPFNREVLLLKIQYVFKLRVELQNQYKVNEAVHVVSGSVSSVDERLLQKIITTVQDNIKNSEFSVEELSKSVGISRIHLNRKMNALVNMTTNDFISMVRLKKAAELLKTGKLNISEVAYDCGFNDPRYFSKCFKEFFGKIPSEWK
jgi:signal transduction histidine kinase/ligand-binding sensor domain-containing protein/DNA-binding response OmpR family regulator